MDVRHLERDRVKIGEGRGKKGGVFAPGRSPAAPTSCMSQILDSQLLFDRVGKPIEHLKLNSTVRDLDLFDVKLDLSKPGRLLTEAFDGSPQLPGVILTQDSRFVGMISRRRFLEMMSRPYSLELFTRRPIQRLYAFLQTQTSIYPGNLPIVEAAIQCLQRSPEFLYEPVVIELEPGAYRLLDVHQLLVAQSYIQQLTAQLVKKRTADLDRANAEILKLNQRLAEENIRLSAEIEVTRQLQQMLLPHPDELCQIPGLEIVGFMEPAAEVGGDYYDVLTHDNGRVLIGIGDVTGHGLESGMLMLMVQTAVRTLLEHDETDPRTFLDVLNRTIYKNIRRMNSDKNLTLALLEYDGGQVHLSGQHEETIVIRANGTVERIDTLDLGFPIGLEEKIDGWIHRTTVQLEPGDGVVLYTDGIIEAENVAGEFYGLERLCEVASRNWNASADRIRSAIVENWWQYIGGHKVYDDVTLIVLKQT